jgi:serine/threonine-protein kinase
MARVFEAEINGPQGFRKPAAVKVVRAALGTDADSRRKSLIREARLGGLLHHPCIVETYDFGEIDGHLFIAMELVRGVPLDRLLAEAGRFPPSIALQVAIAMCDALEHAHAASVDGRRVHLVHRDLKPGNVLVSTAGEVKVADFGIAKAALEGSGTLTAAGVAKGTPYYMSPEQASGEPVDARSDLFALGTVLHEMVTGERLHQGDSLVAIAMALILVDERMSSQGLLEPINELVPGLGPIVAKCIRRNPEERYASAAEVGKELRLLLRTVPDVPMVEFLELCGVGQAEAGARGPAPPPPPPAEVPPTRLVPLPAPDETARASRLPASTTQPQPQAPDRPPAEPTRRRVARREKGAGRALRFLIPLVLAGGVLGAVAIALLPPGGTDGQLPERTPAPEPAPEPAPDALTDLAVDEPTPTPAAGIELSTPPPTVRVEPAPPPVPGPTPAATPEEDRELTITVAPSPAADPTKGEPDPTGGEPEPPSEPTPAEEVEAPGLRITFEDANTVGRRGGKVIVAFTATAECPMSCTLKLYSRSMGQENFQMTLMKPLGGGEYLAEVRFTESGVAHVGYYVEAISIDGQLVRAGSVRRLRSYKGR